MAREQKDVKKVGQQKIAHKNGITILD